MYKNGYLHGSPSIFSAKSAIYTAAVCPNKIAIYTAAIQEPNRLYTLLPGTYTKNRYLHGSRSRAKSAKYIAAGV